jgi:hypothetical protein
MSRETTRDFGRVTLQGRKVEGVNFDPDHVGTIGPLTTATEDVLTYVKRHATEIADEDLLRDRDGTFVHRKTGVRYEVVTQFIDWAQLDENSDVKAFVVRDGLICPLVEESTQTKATSVVVGTLEGRRARADDPMPLGEGTPVIF